MVTAPAIGPEPAGAACKYPIVLEHGFMGSSYDDPAGKGSVWAFHRVKEALERDGHFVFPSSVEPFNSVAVRAQSLAKNIRAARDACRARAGCDASKVHLLAHSMGGLDAREYIRLRKDDAALASDPAVFSVTTISTPHRGSNIADFGVKALDLLKASQPLNDTYQSTVNTLFSLFGWTFTDKDLAFRTNVRDALVDLSEANSDAFNRAHPDDPSVRYATWVGVSGDADDESECEWGRFGSYRGYRERRDWKSPLMTAAGLVTGSGDRPNDGMATLKSAKWDESKFQGCIPADHLDEVGQGKEAADRWTGFDHVRFYRNVAFGLSKLERGK